MSSTLQQKYGPWALVAGGSEGVGEHFARKLAAAGINLVLISRRLPPLQALAEDIVATTGVQVRTATLNLAKPEMLEEITRLTEGLEIGMLVYNAGTDNRAADFLDVTLERVQYSIRLSVIGQTLLCHHFGTAMRARGRGGIILVGSLLGFAGGGAMSVYAASKAYSHTLAKGLWHELRPYGVDVLGLVISATATPAYEKFGLASSHGDIIASSPEKVAQEGLDQLAHGPIHVVSEAAETARNLLALSPGEAVELVSANAAAMRKG